MIELVFIACIAGADHCEERVLRYVQIPSPMVCMMGAQPQLAQWSEAHPDWRIDSWKCRWAATAERAA